MLVVCCLHRGANYLVTEDSLTHEFKMSKTQWYGVGNDIGDAITFKDADRHLAAIILNIVKLKYETVVFSIINVETGINV